MFLPVQSAFLQALGLSIANSLWQMGLLWLLVQLAIVLFRPSAAARYALSASAALAGLLWFGISFLHHWQSAPAYTTAGTIWQTAGVPRFLLTVVAATHWLIPYLAVAYLLMVALLGLRLGNSFRQVNRLRNTGLLKAPAEWRIFVQQYGSILQVGRKVQLYLSNQVSGPLTIGFWKPVILLPLATINQLSPQQMEAVLLHELVHIRRHDYLINIVLQAAEILLFFNPFMRSLLLQAGTERENSCDDLVLQFNYDPREYATALLTLEQQAVKQTLALAAAGNSQHQFQLLHRIRRMVSPGRQSFNYRAQLGLLALLMVITIFSQLLLQRNRVDTQNTTGTMQAWQQGLRPGPTSAAFDLAATMAMISEAAGRLQRLGSPTPPPAPPHASSNHHTPNAARAATENPVGITEQQVPDWERILRTWVTTGAGQQAAQAQVVPQTAWPRPRPLSATTEGLDAAAYLIAQVLAEQALVLEREKASLEEMARLYLPPNIMEALPARVLVLPPAPAESPASGQEAANDGAQADIVPGAGTEAMTPGRPQEMQQQHIQQETARNSALSMEARRQLLAAEIAARSAAIQALEADITKMNRQIMTGTQAAADTIRAPHAAGQYHRSKPPKPRVIIQL